MFEPRKIVDTQTGETRIVSVEEQERMLESGILFDAPEAKSGGSDKPQS